MQKILAIETSGKGLSAAIAENGAEGFVLKGEVAFSLGLRQSELLKGACDFLLHSAHWKKEDLGLIAVTLGPGSFTGLRVGISFARAVAQALKVPLIGVNTFEVLAHGVRQAGWKEAPLLVLIDSIGKDLFAGDFAPGEITPRTDYAVRPVAEILKRHEKQKDLIAIGAGAERHAEEISKVAALVPAEWNRPKASALAELALARSKKVKLSKTSWQKVVPFYLREPLAVERLKGKS